MDRRRAGKLRLRLVVALGSVPFALACVGGNGAPVSERTPARSSRESVADNSRLAAALGYFQQNQYRAAIAECEDAIAADPNDAQAYLLLGVTYFVQDDIERGVLNTDDAFRLNPSYWRGGADDRALQYYNAAVRGLDTTSILKPRYADAFAARGRTHERDGDAAGAIRCCTEAIRLNPELVRAYIARGNALLMQDSFDAAFADYRRAVELKPSVARRVADTCRRRGATARSNGNQAASQQCMDEANALMESENTSG